MPAPWLFLPSVAEERPDPDFRYGALSIYSPLPEGNPPLPGTPTLLAVKAFRRNADSSGP